MPKLYLYALGIVNALGKGKKDVLNALIEGSTNGILPLRDNLVTGQSLPFGYVTSDLVNTPKMFMETDSHNQSICFTALEEIREDVLRSAHKYGPERIAVVVGSCTSGMEEGENTLTVYRKTGEFPDNYRFNRQEIGIVGESIARYFDLTGPAYVISTACSSGAKAFSAASRLIELNMADAVIVGGVDAYCKLTVNGFFSLSALSTDKCLPFSANRSGTVLGEGAAFFLLGKEKFGGEEIFLVSTGESSDAYNITAPDPEGIGAYNCMDVALRKAQINSDNIDYINLHGTGTLLNDQMEARAVNRLFGENIPCSSSKAQVGHTLGAAGAIELGLCWLALSDLNTGGFLPPHIYDGNYDPSLKPIRLVNEKETLSDTRASRMISMSYAFGGSNSAVIIEKNN